jgi:hypothetical protein
MMYLGRWTKRQMRKLNLLLRKVKETKDGTFKEKGDMVDRSRLQIDARKWILSKLLPKKYGDKVEHEHSGGVTVNIQRFAPDADED